jgi:hypothetical protein
VGRTTIIPHHPQFADADPGIGQPATFSNRFLRILHEKADHITRRPALAGFRKILIGCFL